jgi:hypothetical protein
MAACAAKPGRGGTPSERLAGPRQDLFVPFAPFSRRFAIQTFRAVSRFFVIRTAGHPRKSLNHTHQQ